MRITSIFISLFSLLLFASPVHAQRAIQASIYSTLDLREGNYQFGKISLGYTKRNEKGFERTIELFDLRINLQNLNPSLEDSIITNENTPPTVYDFGLGIRHQFLMPLGDVSEKWLPYVGGSLLTGIYYKDFRPHTVNAFMANSLELINQLSITPALRYNISSQLYADLTFFIDFLDFGFQVDRTSNPSLPIRQLRTSFAFLDIYLFRRFQSCLSLGILL